MSWQSESLEILRALVDDLDGNVYTDNKLLRVLIVSAFQVNQEADFQNDYSISVSEQEITPDPTDSGNEELSFLNLFTLKAACLLNRGSAARAAATAVLVKDHNTTTDLRGPAEALVKLLDKGYCKLYEETLIEQQTGKGGVAGAAIMTPIRLYSSVIRRI